MRLPYSFIEAFEKWQQELGIFDEGYLALKNKGAKAIELLQKSIGCVEILRVSFCLNGWIKRRNETTIQGYEDLVRKVDNFLHQTTNFCSSLIQQKMDPVLKIKHLHYTPYPYVLFYTHREDIVFNDGYITLDGQIYEVHFEVEPFQKFLLLEKERYGAVSRDGDLLDRGNHVLEFRALKKALSMPLEDLKTLHAQKGDPARQLSRLALKLQELEPGLNIEWARNLSTLINKLSE